MGLLDNVMGKLGGKKGGDGGADSEGGPVNLQALTKMLSANGGVQGLMSKMSGSGLASRSSRGSAPARTSPSAALRFPRRSTPTR